MNIDNLVSEANLLIEEGKSLATKTTDGIYQKSQYLQGILNDILSTTGVVTQEQLNSLDEQLRLQKIDILKYKSERTKNTIKIVAGSVVAVLVITTAIIIYKKNKEK
jgi:acetolactate synthase small subunit